MFGFLAKFFAGPVIKNIAGYIGDHFEKKRERKLIRMEADITLETKRQEAIMLKDTAEIKWDIIQAKNQAGSWKDEYMVIVLSMPFIGSFLPTIQDHILIGFQYLEQAPDSYLAAWALAVAASFGFRAHAAKQNGK